MPPKKKCFTRIRKNATAMGPAGSVYQGCVQPKKTKEQPKKRRVQPVRKVRQGKDMIVPSPKKKSSKTVYSCFKLFANTFSTKSDS